MHTMVCLINWNCGKLSNFSKRGASFKEEVGMQNKRGIVKKWKRVAGAQQSTGLQVFRL